MKQLLLIALITMTGLTWGATDSSRESTLSSQLNVDSLEVTSLNRDYTEVLTGVLYMGQWFDGYHDYNLALTINDQYRFKCSTHLKLSTGVYTIVFCEEEYNQISFKEFMKTPKQQITFR